jgi:uncharacterized protein YciI
MLYVILGRDAPNTLEARKAARPDHVARLKALQEQGRLVIAGPLPMADAPTIEGGVSGSLLVLEFDSLSAAQQWAQADPYVAAGVYASVEVHPFLKVLPS